MTNQVVIGNGKGKFVVLSRMDWDAIRASNHQIDFNARLAGIVHKNVESDLVYVRCSHFPDQYRAHAIGADHWEEQVHLTLNEGDRIKPFL